MKRAALVSLVLAFAAAACGLKVPVTLVEGSGNEPGPDAGEELVDPTAKGPDILGPSAGPDAAGPDGPVGPNDPTIVSSGLFANETEGVTKETITLCTHVPITGAAPVARHADRFGQFYFNYVNKVLGGVHGRKVRFLAFDDQYYPAGARAAVEKCAKEGAFIYIGAAGTDQIVSVAKWAERKRVPYLHGPTSDKDMKGFKYNIFSGPTYEDQHRLLADYMVKKYGKTKRYGMIRVNSPFFDAGHDAYIDQLKKHGVTLTVDKVVQKDEQQFNDIYFELSKPGSEVDIVNNFTTPNIWIRMLAQKPASYNPLWTAVSPVAGFNLVALALKNSNSRAEVFSSFNPACNCTDYQTDLDRTEKWYPDEQKFLEIFKKYSPEQTPRPDDFDYSAYLAAKGFHRLLLALGKNPTRTGLFTLLKTYKESPAATYPACGADFTREPGLRRGAHHVNVFELRAGKWKNVVSCMDKV